MLKMFNRRAGSEKSRPDEVLSHLDIHSGESIADVGSGGGYFTFRFAEEAGAVGHVYAVDVNAKNLGFIREEAKRRGINGQLTLVLAGEGCANLLDKSVDLVFSRNAFHHIENPIGYFRKLKKALRPGARVVIIDNKKEKGFMSWLGHSSTEEEIVRSLEIAGFRLERSLDFLDRQWFFVFSVAQ